MQQASSPVLQQQLRSLHPGALQTLHQSADGTLYPHNHAGVLPELQTLHTTDVYQQQYALSGPPPPLPPPPPPPPLSHTLPVHFEQNGLSSSGPYPSFQAAGYQHPESPRFMNPPPLQEHAHAHAHAHAHVQQYHHAHASPPRTVSRPIQQLPLPPPPPAPPILPPSHTLPHRIEHSPPPQQHQHEGRHEYVPIPPAVHRISTNNQLAMTYRCLTTANSRVSDV